MTDDSQHLIATLDFDTADWPPDDRFDAWRRHNSGSVFTQVEPGPFSARARIWLLDGVVVSEHWIDPFRGQRDRILAATAALDHVMLILPLTGTTRVRGQGVNVLCRPGDVAVLDYRRPLATDTSRQHGIAISIRRDLLEERCGPIDLHGKLPPSTEARLLLDHVRGLVSHLPSLRRSNADLVTRILRDLIAMAMAPTDAVRIPLATAPLSSPTTSGDQGDRPDLRRRIMAYVAARPPGSISIPVLLRDLGTTRATMYRLFRADGGLLAYDRKRRLAMVHRALCTDRDRQITELGASFGFDDPANLSRLFRRRYGYTMTQLRRGVVAAPPCPPFRQDVPTTYRDAVASLFRD